MSRGCDRKDCDFPARWKLGAKLWAKGYSKRYTPAVQMATGLVLCDFHKNNAGPVGEFFTAQGRAMIDAEFQRRRLAAPDYDSGEWHFEPLGGMLHDA